MGSNKFEVKTNNSNKGSDKGSDKGSGRTKWIIVTGGVVSGLGKGIVTSSIGALLKTQGLRVSATKIDPYINIDAGTMRPTVHGEVFVTFDGGETDQDLGNYERFLDEKISRKNNITTGQIYQEIIRKERNFEYQGSDVEVTKHVPKEIKRRLFENAERTKADFMLVEIGGTVGDYQNIIFLEAVRQMKQEGEPMMFVHVSYLPILANVGEMKTKPTQHSVRALNSSGIFADIIIARAPKEVDDVRKEKISVFCNVKKEDVISAPDKESIYLVPEDYYNQGLGERIMNFFGLEWRDTPELRKLISFAEKVKTIKSKPSLKIGIIGKYFDIGDFTLEDSYISVIEAVKAACYYNDVNPEIKWINSKDYEKDPEKINELKELDGIIIPGGFGSSGVEGKIEAIRFARGHKKPFLGLCYGLQLAIIEWARNKKGLIGANSEEIDPETPHPVIKILPKQADLLAKKQYGNTMRLGEYPARLKKGTKTASLYNDEEIIKERHRHRYEVNPDYHLELEGDGLVFSGMSLDNKLVEFIELEDHPFFIATQSHPEFTSRPQKPNPLFNGFIRAAIDEKNSRSKL